MANSIGVATYDADTGRLSAAFVWNLFRRIYGPKVPGVRYVTGGWQTVADRMAVHARELGVRIELGSRVDTIPATPTIIATELASARTLLGDASLHWQSGHCVMLDLAVREGRRDLFTVADLDEGGFHECYSMQDRSVAPRGESLFQIDMPVRAGESIDQARTRLFRFTDLTVPGWRDRVTWQRTATAKGRTGAIDLPGQTWRDRPAIDQGSGVYLVGDMVAGPGMRGEIAINSALDAAAGVLSGLRRREECAHERDCGGHRSGLRRGDGREPAEIADGAAGDPAGPVCGSRSTLTTRDRTIRADGPRRVRLV